jgi:hypothetical protein
LTVAPEGVRNKVSIDKDDRDACLAQHGCQSAVDLVSFGHQLVGSEEDPAHPALDELAAEFFRVLHARIGVELRLARTTPDQTVVVHSRQTGDFSASCLLYALRTIISANSNASIIPFFVVSLQNHKSSWS